MVAAVASRRPALFAAAVFLAVVPPALIIASVVHYAVNVPYCDQWMVVSRVADFVEGRASLATLWASHNEHRFPIPFLLMLVLFFLDTDLVRREGARLQRLGLGPFAARSRPSRPAPHGDAGGGAIAIQTSRDNIRPTAWRTRCSSPACGL